MDACAETFFDGADGAFNLANVTVGGDNVDVDGAYVVANAVKLVVNVKVADLESAACIELDDGGDFLEDCGVFSVWDGAHGAELNVPRDSV